MAVEDLVLGPFDGVVKKGKVAQMGKVSRPIGDALPLRRRAIDAGEDNCDVEIRELLKLLGEQASTRWCYLGYATQIENDKLRTRSTRQSPRDIVNAREGERPHQLKDPHIPVIGSHELPLMGPAAAARGTFPYVVFGDHRIARVIAPAEHVQPVMRRQGLAYLDAAHAVAMGIEPRRIAAQSQSRRQRRQ